MVTRMWPLLAVLCLLQPGARAEANVSVYGHLQVERFADHLFEEGDYERAWVEYQRAAFVSHGSDTLLYKAGVSLRLSGEGAQAARWFRSAELGCKPSDMHRSALYQQCYGWLHAGRADSAALAVERSCRAVVGPWEEDAAYLRGSARLIDGDWAAARDDFAVLGRNNLRDGIYLASVRLDSIAQAAATHPRKNPLTARLLSALVPGLGRVYAGRSSDALSSFTSVVGTGWVAHRSFERDGEESVAGWAYSALSLAFYLGEIYGAGESAADANRKADDNYRAKGIRVFMSYHPQGIGLRGEFSLPPGTD